MGKMRFGEKKQVSSEGMKIPQNTIVKTEVVEKIVEVPVEVVKEKIVMKEPENKDLPKKYADAEVEALRKDMLKRFSELNDKNTETRAKLGKFYVDLDNKIAQCHGEGHDTEKLLDELSLAVVQDMKELRGEMITKIIDIRKEQKKAIQVHIGLGIGLLISLLMHLL